MSRNGRVMSERSPGRVLEVTSYPPPRTGWAVRTEFVKKRLDEEGHRCVVLNIGPSRHVPSPEYEMVHGGGDLLRKVWRYSREGFTVHAHANGDAVKGAVLALVVLSIALIHGRRSVLTFHAGAIQRFFPIHRSWLWTPLYWLLFLLPRDIVCNSEAVKTCIRQYGVPAGKITPIPAFSAQYMEFEPADLPPALEQFFSSKRHVVFTYIRLRPLFYPLTLLDAVARICRERPDVGVVLCGASAGHFEPELKAAFEQKLQDLDLAPHVCLLEDLGHDAFLTALQRSVLYLRTPITDGVASSVLESIALGVPVVACDNGTRPKGVVLYPAEDAALMAQAVIHTIDHRAEVMAAQAGVEVRDTVADEVALLTR
jgi:glycosyltransferase involved in cell wall biosynthesis